MIQDLHAHTYYSFCCNDRVETVIETAIANGIQQLGICDHNYGIGCARTDFCWDKGTRLDADYGKTLVRYYDHIKALKEKYEKQQETKKLLETFNYRPTLGINFDPSHLVWQGMDPVAAIRELKGAIYHVHAKDTKIDSYNTAKNGVLDTKHYGDEINRSWIFRTIGYGNDNAYWKEIISNLRMVGYDYAISIEHEDSLMSQNEGLRKAVELLKKCIIKEDLKEAWWI